MDVEDISELIAMQIMARGLTAILEDEGSASCKPGNQAYNEVSTGVGWLHERLEEFARRMMQEV